MRTLVRAALAGALLITLALPVSVDAKGKGSDDRPRQPAERRQDDDRRRDDRGKGDDAERARVERAQEKSRSERAKREEEAKHGRGGDDRAQRAIAPNGRQPLPAPVSNPAPSTSTTPPPPPPTDPAAVAPLPPPTAPVDPRQFGYGAHVADMGRNAPLVRAMGFNYVKGYLPWSGSEPAKGVYQWAVAPDANDADNVADEAARHGLRLVLRVDMAPDWAAAPGVGNRPPTNPQDFADFMGALAGHLRGRVVAYELWNEPNLAGEWGGGAPSPEHFAAMVRAAYPAIKAADPGAVVVTGGLATTGGDGGATALDDLEFLRRMYAAGVGGHFDALGSHPYGFATGPESRHPQGMDLQRSADHYALMVENGDGDKAVWATEMGWLLDPGAFGQPELVGDPSWAGREWQKVDPQAQAQHLVRAFDYARENWPWMGVMLLFNADFSTVGYYAPGEQMRWYAVVNGDGSPRPAFEALRSMPKPVR
jgi:hypothetical protein